MRGKIDPPSPLRRAYTKHATKRTRQRAIPYRAVEAALDWGTEFRVRGGFAYWLTDKAIRHARSDGIDVAGFRGVWVMTSYVGRVVTGYRRCPA